MKSPVHKYLSLAGLEWLLPPPVALGRYALADTKLSNGKTVLAGFVLWACVAPDVDARLTQSERHPIRLQPSEWPSGGIWWIVEAVGHPSTVRNLINELAKNAFGGNQFKMLRPLTDSAFPVQ